MTDTLGNVASDKSAEPDPFNTNADLHSPAVTAPPRVPGEQTQGYIDKLGFGDLFAHVMDRCFINGMEMPCQMVGFGAEGYMSAPSSNVGSIYSMSDHKYIGAAIWNPALAAAGISVLGWGVGNNVGWVPAGSTLGTLNGHEGVFFPDWFAQLSANEWTPQGETFVSLNAAALSTAMDRSFYGGSAAVGDQPLPQSRRVSVIDGFFELYSRLKNGEVSKRCQKEVIDKLQKKLGFNLAAFVAYLSKGAHFYDGTSSSTLLAGGITSPSAASVVYKKLKTVADAFANNHSMQALTSIETPSLTVFFRPNDPGQSAKGYDFALVFHEALHGFGGSLGGTSYFDADIQKALGIKVDPNNSGNITDTIRENCF